MNKRIIVLWLMISVLLFGCQAAETATPSPVSDVEVAEEAALPTETPLTALPPATDYCLECHTDQEKLTALAKPEVEAEGESKGVG